MRCLRGVVCGAVLGTWALVVVSTGDALAESPGDPTAPRVSNTQEDWQQKVLRRGEPRPMAPQQPGTVRSVPREWSPVRTPEVRTPVRTVSGVMQPGPGLPSDGWTADDLEAVPGEMDAAPIPMDDVYGGYESIGPCDSCGDCSLGMCGDCGCGACGDCAYGACGPGYPGCWYGPWWGWQQFWHRQSWWISHFSFFAGVHGFKGIADRGRNGNFGFHEGLNWGAPLGDPFNLGYQLGVQVVHSDFSGHQAAEDDIIRCSDRDQVFFTGGLFRRAPCGGMQGGVVFDLLHDRYYATANLRQIRTESALVFSCGRREIGFWGAFGVSDDVLDFYRRDQAENGIVLLKPRDTYSLFYRRHFSGGGQGRVWAGISGNGDALLGGDCRIPIGTHWALENSFTYMVPKDGSGGVAQQEETWNVSIHLVWYPCREARCAINSPFHPLFRVADNGLFLLNTRE